MPPDLSYESGRQFAGVWADLLVIEFEHYGLNTIGLSSFMQGIRDETPTKDSMVTVMATLPMSGNSAESKTQLRQHPTRSRGSNWLIPHLNY